MIDLDFILRVLRLVAAGDIREFVNWRCDGGFAPVTFAVDCSDILDWGSADVEPITPANVDEFERALREVADITGGDHTYGPVLFACRMRRTRPQNAAYPSDTRLHPLFDACGPARSVDLHNPQQTKGQPAPPPERGYTGAVTAVIASITGDPPLPCCDAVSLAASVARGGPDHCGLCGTRLVTVNDQQDEVTAS